MNFLHIDPASCARLLATFGHFLWQGAAILVLVWLVVRQLRRHAPTVRYAVLLAALILMAACPPLTFILVGEQSPAPAPAVTSPEPPLIPWRMAWEDSPLPGIPEVPFDIVPEADSAVPSSPLAAVAMDWRRYAPSLVAGYFAVAALLVARCILGVCGGQRLRRRALPVEEASILTAFSRQARLLGLRCTPAIAMCRDVCVPTVVGVLRPMILLPLTLATGLSAEQVEMLLAHELAHIRRHDHLVNLAQRLIEAALFFHPAVWIVSRRLSAEREHCCDDIVLAAGSGALAYAGSLVRMAELTVGRTRPAFAAAAALGADGRPSELGERIRRLVGGPDHQSIRLLRAWTLAAIALVAIGLPLTGLLPAEAKPQEPQPVVLSDARPIIEADETEKDLGEAWAGTELSHTFVVSNRGGTPLEFTARPACGCTMVDGSKTKTVAPGKSLDLPVTLNTQHLSTTYSKTILLRSNDPVTPELTLRLKGSAKPRIERSPVVAALGDFTSDASREVIVKLLNRTDQPLHLDLKPLNSQTLRAELSQRVTGQEYNLKVSTVGPHQTGPFSGEILLETNIPEEKTIKIPVFGRVVLPLDVNPTRLMYGPTVGGSNPPASRTRWVRLTNNAGTPVKLLEAEIDDRKVAVSVQDIPGGKAWAVKLEFPEGYTVPAGGRTLKLITDDAEKPVLTCAVLPLAATTVERSTTRPVGENCEDEAAAQPAANSMAGQPAPWRESGAGSRRAETALVGPSSTTRPTVRLATKDAVIEADRIAVDLSKAASRPAGDGPGIEVIGAVVRPGSYTLAADRPRTLSQLLLQAGGLPRPGSIVAKISRDVDGQLDERIYSIEEPLGQDGRQIELDDQVVSVLVRLGPDAATRPAQSSFVDISGDVVRPGRYELDASLRPYLREVLTLAGGPASGVLGQVFVTRVVNGERRQQIYSISGAMNPGAENPKLDEHVVSVEVRCPRAITLQPLAQSMADGVVTAIHVRQGDSVRAGQVLIQLDDAEIRLETEAAEVRLTIAKEELEHNQKSHAGGLTDRAALAKAESSLRLADIELRRCKLRLDRTRITSPVDGVVTWVETMGLGHRVQAGQKLVLVRPPANDAAADADDAARAPMTQPLPGDKVVRGGRPGSGTP